MRSACLILFGMLSGQALSVDPPVLECASAILVEEKTGRVLFEKNADTPRFPASTTKIMTALLLIERVGPETMITAPADIKLVKPSSMHLMPGERLSMVDLLHGIMLRSANDGSVAAAVHMAGSVPKFAKLMNERAKSLGMKHTNYVNPHGLHDPKHVTSARDLMILARYAMTLPAFREVVRKKAWSLTRSMNTEDLLLENKNRLLKVDATYDGIKTGFTRPAAECFAGSAVRNEMRLLSVVLKADDYALDTKALIDWGFANHLYGEAIKRGDELSRVPIEGATKETVVGLAATSLEGPIAIDEEPEVTLSKVELPIKKGQVLGIAKVSGLGEVQIIATEDVSRRFPTGIYGLLMGSLMVGAYALVRRKRARLVGLG